MSSSAQGSASSEHSTRNTTEFWSQAPDGERASRQAGPRGAGGDQTAVQGHSAPVSRVQAGTAGGVVSMAIAQRFLRRTNILAGGDPAEAFGGGAL